MNGLMSFARAHFNNFISVEENDASSFYRWLFYYSPYVRLWEFVLGCLTAQLFLLLRNHPISAREHAWGSLMLHAALCTLLIYALVYVMRVENILVRQLVGFFSLNFGGAVPIAVLIFCVARYRSSVAAFLSLPWIVWLGDISYSIYAVHTWTLRPLIRRPVELNLVYGADAIVRIFLAIMFTIIVASATYAIIEVPCRRYLRARLMRQPRHRAGGLDPAEARKTLPT
jgi:peptidoglycan/LPS O-acetylase OafA/YrhL